MVNKMKDLRQGGFWLLPILSGFILLAYWNSWNIPWYFDDFYNIVENKSIQDLSNWQLIWAHHMDRFVGFFSFALNYHWHQDAVQSYHAVNLIIHLLSGLAVFFLVKALMTAQNRQSGHLDPDLNLAWLWLPLFAALWFVVHPVQIQAVSYVVQRFSSLAAWFYLMAMAAYVSWRLKPVAWKLIGVFMCLPLAFLSKQNAATLPLALVLIELLFFRKLSQAARYKVFALALFSMLAVFALLHWQPLDELTRENSTFSRLDYWLTQSQVLWYYLKLTIWPSHLYLEYDWPLLNQWDIWLVLAVMGHIALWVLAFLQWEKRPLISFGILFFYLAHAVESSFLPITDVVVEHRMYLPLVGPILILVAVLAPLARKRPKSVWWFAAILALPLTYLSYERNQLWLDQAAFYQNELSHAPNKERLWIAYGTVLQKKMDLPGAVEAYEKAYALGKQRGHIEANTMISLAIGLYHLGHSDRAENIYQHIPMGNVKRLWKSKLLEARGFDLIRRDAFEAASEVLAASIEADPGNVNARSGYVVALTQIGRGELAAKQAQMVLDAAPDHPIILNLIQLGILKI